MEYIINTNGNSKNVRCLFEMNMTNMKKYRKTAPDSVYLVQLESMTHKEIPLESLILFQAELYIEYPCDMQGNMIFWEKLKNIKTIKRKCLKF